MERAPDGHMVSTTPGFEKWIRGLWCEQDRLWWRMNRRFGRPYDRGIPPYRS